MQSVLIETLGCKLNQLESEAITSAFLREGFVLTDGKNADVPSVIVINTCTVTSKADQKARRAIRKALRDYPDSCVIVTGCYAQLNHADLYRLDEAGSGRLLILKGMDKTGILELPRYLYERRSVIGAQAFLRDSGMADNGSTGAFQFNPECFSEHTRSFLKIQDGCGKHCTYCRIRLARGASVSLDADEALARLRTLEKSHGEAVLTGVNISQYCDKERAASLASLLEYLLAGTRNIRLRLSSLAPESVDEELAGVLSHERIRPHFHLSVQSGSRSVLDRMGRSYSAETVVNAVSLLRGAKGDPFMACDIIAGFSGETEADFIETLELCERLDFAWVHVFPYSRRPGTPAWAFTGTVHEGDVSDRVRVLTELAREGRAGYARRWVGREVEAVVERGGDAGFCRCVSENYLKLRVRYEGDAPLPGAVLRCRLVELGDDFDAFAEVV